MDQTFSHCVIGQNFVLGMFIQKVGELPMVSEERLPRTSELKFLAENKISVYKTKKVSQDTMTTQTGKNNCLLLIKVLRILLMRQGKTKNETLIIPRYE